MKKNSLVSSFVAIVVVFCASVCGAQAQGNPVFNGLTPEQVLQRMTLQQKIKLLSGIGMPEGMGSTETVAGNITEGIPGAAGSTVAFPELGIPAIYFADGPAGLRMDTLRAGDSHRYYSTAFPTGTLLASTWDVETIARVGTAAGNELSEYGLDVWLAPGMNIQRNPLCGRNFEYYSEDPLLAGTIAAAMTRSVQEQGIGVSIKHFAANNCETNRSNINSVISERALREIYLRPFQRAIYQCQPWTVMSSYNKINGVYASQSKDLLETILRTEWGLQGLVMTDWLAGRDFAAQAWAGCDLLMPGRPKETKDIVKAVAEGSLSEADIDRNALRVLQLIARCHRNTHPNNNPDLKAHAAVSRQAAAEGMILLKNEGIKSALPLARKNRVAMFGTPSYDTFIGGNGSGEVYKAYVVSIAEGLRNTGLNVNQQLAAVYNDSISKGRKGMKGRTNVLQKIETIPEISFSDEDIKQYARQSDVALLTIGRTAGESRDRSLEDDYQLSDKEMTLLRQVADAFHAQKKKVVVILNIDGLIDMSWSQMADAILLAWLPGQEAGNAVVDIISGRVCPSGRLPITIPARYDDVPSAKSFPGVPAKRPKESIYDEGVFVGYRYYNTFGVTPAYEFGYGLSYTSFAYSDLQVSESADGKSLMVSFDVTNTGKVAGREVCQVYVSAPAGDTKAEINWQGKPAEELRGFAKTRQLKPGEKQHVSIEVRKASLASFYPSRSAWVADEGEYTIKVGSSSRQFHLSQTWEMDKELVVERTQKVMLPQVSINELKLRDQR